MRTKYTSVLSVLLLVVACTHRPTNSEVTSDILHAERLPQNIGVSHFESGEKDMKENRITFENIMNATFANNGLNRVDEKFLTETVLPREKAKNNGRDPDVEELDAIVKGLRMRSFIFRNMDYFNVAQSVINEFDKEIDRLTLERETNSNSSGTSALREELSEKLRVLYAWRQRSSEEMDSIYYFLLKESNDVNSRYNKASVRILNKTASTYKKECEADASMCLAIYSVMKGLAEVEQEYLTFYPNGKVPNIADQFQWTDQQYKEFVAAQKSPTELTSRRQKENAARFKRFLDKMIRDFQLRDRAPQYDKGLMPDPGPNGNTTGRAFEKGTWAITMDDGPHKVNTLSIEQSFRKRGLKGTFFWLSQNIPKLPAVVKTVKDGGHDLASHSYSHANLPALKTQAELNREIFEAADIFEKNIGHQPTLFRCPYGACKPGSKMRQMIAERKMLHAFWTIDTLDWQDKNPQVIFDRTKKQMELDGKGMVLFHDIHLQSAQAIEMLLEWMTTKHQEWKHLPLSEIIRTQSRMKDFKSPAP